MPGPDPPDPYDAEIERFLRLFEGIMRLENLTIRDVERSLGWGKGTLNRIFSGRIELKLRHILMLCDAVGIQPEHFFLLGYKKMPPGSSLVQHILVGRAEIEAQAPAPPPPPPVHLSSLTTEDLKNVMRATVEELLADRERRAAARPEPASRKGGAPGGRKRT